MATIAEITRAGNTVQTVGQAAKVIGDALTDVGTGYRKAGISDAEVRTLDRVRGPLEAWYREIKGKPASTPYKAEFLARRDTITRAYVELEGIDGRIVRTRSVTYWDSVKEQAPETFKAIGEGVGAVAAGAGDLAGGALVGLLQGLGPVILVIVIVLVVVNRSKVAA